MIVKRIDNPRQESSKTGRIGNLLDYIVADVRESGDKADLVFASGDFISESWQAQRGEMIALAMEATRSDDPIDHWLFSWKEGETPTEEQCREAVEILKRHLGLREDHLAMCALHQDTDNYHLHTVLSRVDPTTYRVADSGWCIDKAHQAVAEIVKVQDWEPETNARYVYDHRGKLTRNSQRSGSGPRTRALDWENATGEKSCERIGIEMAGPLLAKAQSWGQVHSELARIGMRYEMKGSGAVIWVGNQPVKASAIGRDFSKVRMETRLGTFEPVASEKPVQLLSRAPQPLRPGMPASWPQHQAGLSDRRKQKDAAVTKQRASHMAERDALFAKFRSERKALYEMGPWPGIGLNVARSLLAGEHARTKEELVERHRRERNELQKRFGRRLTFEQFLIEQGADDLAEAWRFRDSSVLTGSITGDGDESIHARDIRDFIAAVQQPTNGQPVAIEYRPKNASRPISFIDRGKRIDVVQLADEAAVLAALQLATQKWGLVTVAGPAEFKLLCSELAAKHGFRISNPEIRSQEADAPSNGSVKPNVYEAHRADILKRIDVRNPSRLDWMIAVRMRVTGHDQSSIADTLKSNAMSGRKQEERDWSKYAERTARAVFGPRGDRECQLCSSRAVAWTRIEGRVDSPTLNNVRSSVRRIRSRDVERE